MYYLKLFFLVPIALIWDLIFGIVTLIYRGFEWVDRVVGNQLENLSK